MRSVLIILLLFSILSGSSQRISSGINLQTPFSSTIHFKQEYYNLTNTNLIYTVNSLEESNKKYKFYSPMGLGSKHYKVFGIGAGYMIKTDFKRWTIRSGIQINYLSTGIKLHMGFNRSTNGTVLFTLHTVQYQIPILFSYSLKKAVNSPFILAGAEYGSLFFAKNKIHDLEFDRFYVPFLYGHYYSEKSFINLLFGYGIKKKLREWYFSYQYRMDKEKKELSMNHSTISFNYNIFLNYKSYHKQHFLYTDE